MSRRKGQGVLSGKFGECVCKKPFCSITRMKISKHNSSQSDYLDYTCYHHKTKSGKVTIPFHVGDIPKRVIHSIMKQAGLK